MYDKTIFQNNLLKKFESIVTVMNCFCTEYFQIYLVKLYFYFSEMLFFSDIFGLIIENETKK